MFLPDVPQICLLEQVTVSTGKQIPKFPRNLLAPSSGKTMKSGLPMQTRQLTSSSKPQATICLSARRHTPDEMNFQQHLYKNLQSSDIHCSFVGSNVIVKYDDRWRDMKFSPRYMAATHKLFGSIFCHERGGSTYLWNAGDQLPDYTVLYPRRQSTS